MNEYQTARKALQDAGFSFTAINRLLAEPKNLHDDFVMAAITGFCAGPRLPAPSIIAYAYEIADEAIAKRAK
jgi:hypothetical protein